ncbi:MAG: sugar transferase [Nakamurella sp.]
MLLADTVVLILVAITMHFVRFYSMGAGATGPEYLLYFGMTVTLITCWMLALKWSGSRDERIIGYGSLEYRRVIQATFAVFGFGASVSYLTQLELPRSYLLVMLPLGMTALLIVRHRCRGWLHRKRRQGQYLSRMLVVGNRDTVTELIRDLRRAPQAGYQVVGVCVGPMSPASGDARDLLNVAGVPVLGGLDDVAQTAKSSGVDTVAVTSTASFGPSRVRRLSWELEDTDAELILAPAITNIAGPRIQTQPVAGLPLIHVDKPTYHGANKLLKRSFDVGGATLLLLLLSPVLLATAIAIRATMKGPVFFRQERVGINGEFFSMIKFRSMVVDAETQLDALRAEQRDAGNTVLFKLKSDPRVTPVGRFIRRFSIDELPQLFNVIAGDMSLVGPRPPLKAEVEMYGDEARRRLLVKPGMTGMWQISGRSDLTWDDAVYLDVYYVENWSITSDLVILWKTAKAVVSSSGAY